MVRLSRGPRPTEGAVNTAYPVNAITAICSQAEKLLKIRVKET
jgi:hypothetical protein